MTTMNTATNLTTPTPTTSAPQRRRAEITLVSDTEVRITREFDAPARLVYEASTRPEYIARWYGCSDMDMVRCEIDLREGGKYHWALRSSDGSEHHFRGVYRERRDVALERLVVAPSPPEPDFERVLRVDDEERGGHDLSLRARRPIAQPASRTRFRDRGRAQPGTWPAFPRPFRPTSSSTRQADRSRPGAK